MDAWTDLDQMSKKNQRSRADQSRQSNTKRVLAPFLARHRKKTKPVETDVQERYRNVYLQTKPAEVLAKLGAYFTDTLELPTVLNETSEIMKTFTKSDGVSLYLVDPSNEFIVLTPKYQPRNDRHLVRYPIEPGTTVAAYVAYVQEFIISDDILGDPRFPQGIPGTGRTVKSVLCLPVNTNTDGTLLAVIELYRTIFSQPYNMDELQMAVAITGWMGAAIHQNNQKLLLMKESELTGYLMNILQLLFSGVIAFDKFVTDTVIFVKTTVGAERGAFYFVVDDFVEGSDDDMIAEVYEEAIDGSYLSFKKKSLQRFSKNQPGLAAFAARHGKTVNISDAYADERFNNAGDVMGFRTRSVIAVPIKSSLNVFGVLKLVNKVPRFTDQDEHLLQTVTTYALLGCQFAKTVNQLRKTVRRYDGSSELLNIHMRPCPDDLELLVSSSVPKVHEMPKGYFGFDWFLGGQEKHSPHYAMFSFSFCLGPNFFDHAALCHFILMTKKSYRQNPYHNFIHAFTVFHCMFNIINRNFVKFTLIEKAAMLIAALCHDADHFGHTNSFLSVTDNWLAELYEESSLEHHHYNICMSIIKISDLFSRLTSEQYQQMVKLIETLILSTDLAVHFRSRGTLSNVIRNGLFDWSNRDHRLMYMNLIMTCCDISGQCKPFVVAKLVTESLYREFYNQGDKEKKLGLVPLAMMDRDQMDTIPADQIQFLTIVCIPCLEILVAVLPNTQPLLRMCLSLREQWRDIKREKDVHLWWPEESLCRESKPVVQAGKCGKFRCYREEAERTN